MWAQAGFPPDDFWHQTPRHLQLVMKGVRKRMEAEQQAATAHAYEAGAFGGLAHHGKLKALTHYMKPDKAQTPQEMLAMLKAMGGKSDMKITRRKLN